ncbi:MAG: DNA topoisomerase VI subunit B [Phycisphaerae bacterium]
MVKHKKQSVGGQMLMSFASPAHPARANRNKPASPTPPKPIAKPTQTHSTPPRAAKAGPNSGRDDTDGEKPARSRTTHATAESMAKMQRDISVSEFFAKNRHLLGFDNKRKALLMCVKEAVDNALDACEEAGHLPEVEVRIAQTAEERFRVTVKDNGPGIVKQQIPNVFGKLLYGSKFHRLKMSRGQQGIGISAAGMYGLLTTGKSVKITSRISPKKDAHYYEIQIDTKKNAPNIVKDETTTVDWDTGTQVEIELAGSYNKGRQSVDEYIEQTAIANPHVRIHYQPPVGEPVTYDRGTDVMPAQTQEIKPHPHGVELGLLIKMLHETRSHWLSGFLQSEFCRVGPKVAEEICQAARLNPRAHPKRIARQEAEKLYEAIQKTRLMSPPTNCLAPIGAEQILTGLLKGVKAEFFTASTRPPAVYRGNPFQIEVGIAYGGSLGPDPKAENEGDSEVAVDALKAFRRGGKLKSGNGNGSGSQMLARVIRFANRVPLLYQQSACCMYKSVIDVDWRRYGLSQSSGALPQAPMVVLVHMASVWVPFTSESKEAIADYDEIRAEIKLALQDCGRKLSAYLNRRRKMKYQGERRSLFEKYITEVVNACATIKRINKAELTENLLAMSRKATAQADDQLDQHGKRIGSDSEYGENTVVVDQQDHAAGNPGPLFQATA